MITFLMCFLLLLTVLGLPDKEPGSGIGHGLAAIALVAGVLVLQQGWP